jgi:hypothetical protein
MTQGQSTLHDIILLRGWRYKQNLHLNKKLKGNDVGEAWHKYV